MSVVTLMRFLATVIILGGVWLIDRQRRLMTLSPAVLVQGLFFVASAILYSFAVQHLSAGLATVILFIHPALVALLALVFSRKKIVARQVLGLVLAALGPLAISGLLVPDAVTLSALGIWLSMACAIVYGVYVLLGQHTVKHDSALTITFTLALLGLVVSSAIFPRSVPELFRITPLQALLGLALALFGTVLPMLLLLKGMRLVGASMASLVSVTEIPFSLVLAFLVLGEELTVLQVAGTVLIAVATVIAGRPAPQACGSGGAQRLTRLLGELLARDVAHEAVAGVAQAVQVVRIRVVEHAA